MSHVTLVSTTPADAAFAPPASRYFVPPRPWEGARVGKCYNNVQEMIRRQGGEAVYGWALTDFGPHQIGGPTKPPLYRRWINHVVWRDGEGLLWEVSPNVVLDASGEKLFLPTEFVPEPEATFEVVSDEEWITRSTRYLPTRVEGVPVAELLAQAQHATTEHLRLYWLRKALEALLPAGFQPREWKVETIGNRTGSIWLIAE